MVRESFFIVGLGNPGVEYQGTRHNLGFTFLDYLVGKFDTISSFKIDRRAQAEIAFGFLAGKSVTLVKPQTFMNSSGLAVRALCRAYDISEIPPLVVVYDDLDLTLGRVKLQRGGGSGGHNGLKSLIAELESEDFLRVRLGIASDLRDRERDTVEFVLGSFTVGELQEVDELKPKVAAGILQLLEFGESAAMNQLNRRA